MFECVCSQAGQCSKHFIFKNSREYEICNDTAEIQANVRQRYIDAWERFEYPGQPEKPPKGKKVVLDTVAKENARAAVAAVKARLLLRHTFIHKDREYPELLGPLDLAKLTRHCLFFIMPLAGKGDWVWKRQIERLCKHLHLFDKICVGVVTSKPDVRFPLVHSKYVVQEFEKYGYTKEKINFIVKPNNRRKREGITFLEQLEYVMTDDPNTIVFYGQAKGIQYAADPTSRIHKWTEAMYEHTYENYEKAQEALNTHIFAGSFKKYGQFNTPRNHKWHYSGSFYWFRAADLWKRQWAYIDGAFFGVESWPGLHAKQDEGACLCMEDVGDMYGFNWESYTYPGEKVGIALITCDRLAYFKQSYNALVEYSNGGATEVVVVDDGSIDGTQEYIKENVKSHSILHSKRQGVAIAKNDALQYLLQKGCTHLFVIEDDILVKDSKVCLKYVKYARQHNLHHLNFALHGTLNIGNLRHYKNTIACYPECVGAYSYYSKEALERVGLLDPIFHNAWEHMEWTYRASIAGLTTPFWYFADHPESAELLGEIPGSIVNSCIRADKNWERNVVKAEWYFKRKHGVELPIRP